jgi:hypothetical protein
MNRRCPLRLAVGPLTCGAHGHDWMSRSFQSRTSASQLHRLIRWWPPWTWPNESVISEMIFSFPVPPTSMVRWCPWWILPNESVIPVASTSVALVTDWFSGFFCPSLNESVKCVGEVLHLFWLYFFTGLSLLDHLDGFHCILGTNKNLQRYILINTIVPMIMLLFNHQNHKQLIRGHFPYIIDSSQAQSPFEVFTHQNPWHFAAVKSVYTSNVRTAQFVLDLMNRRSFH